MEDNRMRSRLVKKFTIASVIAVALFAFFANAASSPGDVVGKVTVGYQGWFACKGDGAPINGWWHYTLDWGNAPSPTNQGIKSWPDMRDYAKSYQTGYQNLGNGQPAKLFSSFDQSTVNTQFSWMHQYGIDCAALQRFNPNGGEGPTRDSMAQRVKAAAELNSVKFYIMYDITNWNNMQAEIKTDWTNKMSKLAASPMYARQNDKPVVCIWGIGYTDANHPFTAAACNDVVSWFKNQGCYIIAGVPREWRSQTAFTSVYHNLNMISPWLIGALSDVNGADFIYNNFFVPDIADCKTNGVDYQPCVLSGDLQLKQRVHGDLMWRMFYNSLRAGCQGIYISMFDEYNEGNQIAKTAETKSQVPVGSNFLALDEDGTICSSDYYLRIAGDGGKMLKKQIALTAVRPTKPIIPIRAIAQMAPLSKCRAITLTITGHRPIPLRTYGTQLTIYDCSGRLVATLGIKSGRAAWDAKPARGTYIVRGIGTQTQLSTPIVIE
jgi:hypothetical protein